LTYLQIYANIESYALNSNIFLKREGTLLNKRVVVLTILVLIMLPLLCGCPEQIKTKQFGGKMTIDLPKGQKLVIATWKSDSNLWYLTRPMRPGETPETYEFVESAAFGVWEGKVIFKESK
jgi:hypothetical protein